MEFLKKNEKLIRMTSIALSALIVLVGITYITLRFVKKDLFLDKPQLVAKGDAFVTFIKGDVYYRSSLNSYAAWKQLIVGDVLESTFMLRTREGAEAQINFSDKSLIALEEYSFLLVEEFTAETLRLELKRGVMVGKFNKLYEGQPLQIKTPTSMVSIVKDTSMMVQLSPKGRKSKPKGTRLSVLSGVIEVVGKTPNLSKKVYVSTKESLSISKNSMKSVQKMPKALQSKLNLRLDGLYESEEYSITAKIEFEPNSYEIDIDSFFELDKVLRVLRKKPNLSIKIKGHADSEGREFYNDDLSQKRALAIREYFIESGISRDRFRIKGYGENIPVATNATVQGRKRNRRVDFDIRLE